MHGLDMIHTRVTNPLKRVKSLEPGGSGKDTHARDTKGPQGAQGIQVGVRKLHTTNGQTSQRRHMKTQVLQSAVFVNDFQHSFTANPDVAFPFTTRVPSTLQLERLSMTQQDGRVPNNLICANLSSISEHDDYTHGIVRN